MGSLFFFQLTQSFEPHYGPGIDSASNRNEYQEFSGGKWRPARKADNLTVICELQCTENVGASTSHNPLGLHGLLHGYLSLYVLVWFFSKCDTINLNSKWWHPVYLVHNIRYNYMSSTSCANFSWNQVTTMTPPTNANKDKSVPMYHHSFIVRKFVFVYIRRYYCYVDVVIQWKYIIHKERSRIFTLALILILAIVTREYFDFFFYTC
jgi:hypothetical protein